MGGDLVTTVDEDGSSHLFHLSSRFVLNLLIGKEWTLGISENKFLGLIARLNMMGGQRVYPADRSSSLIQGDVIYDYSRPFEDQKQSIVHLNASLSYRINKKKYASIMIRKALFV
jgi:hypothetical protein